MKILEYDSSFLLGLREGKDENFNKFYLETVDFFFRWIKSVYFIKDDDVKDILSDFYFKVWDSKDFIPKDKSGFKRWIWFILKNVIKDFFKKKRLYSFSDLNDSYNNDFNFEDCLLDDGDIFKEIDKNYKLELIKQAMKELKDIYRQVLVLKYVENLSNSEIAEFLGISNEVVRQRISRGLRKLKYILDSKFNGCQL